MKLRTPILRAGFAATLLAGFYAFTQPVDANAPMFDVDANAPLAATLLPTLTVSADAHGVESARLDDADALPVTLLPTVHVRARSVPLASAAPRATRFAAVTPVAAMRASSAD